MGWIGVDLDGTLAEYGGWVGPDHIGEPVPAMAFRVRKWIEDGKDVRIFTARAVDPIAAAAVQRWCQQHFCVPLPVTATKDYAMIELWDDRAIQVEPNTGRRVDGKP
jgi:hypothetical protein